MDSLKVTDDISKAAQKTTNRVALSDIEAAIVGEFYMNGGEAAHVFAREVPRHGSLPASWISLSVLTICIIVMRNGFTVIGKSAPADAANFDAEVGKKFAREDAIRQIWPLMGFALRDSLMSAA